MLKKEFKLFLKNPAYLVLLFLPFFLAFLFSQGTSAYFDSFYQAGSSMPDYLEVELYQGKLLTPEVQFTVSSLNFMLLMLSTLSGLSIFEERHLHVLDRISNKKGLLLVKFISHFVYACLIVVITLFLASLIFSISFPLGSVLLMLILPLISISLGLLVGLSFKERSLVSNLLMMVAMTCGFFGGAFNLSSALANKKIANYLSYLSPLTHINRLVFEKYLNLTSGLKNLIYIGIFLLLLVILSKAIERRLKYDIIL